MDYFCSSYAYSSSVKCSRTIGADGRTRTDGGGWETPTPPSTSSLSERTCCSSVTTNPIASNEFGKISLPLSASLGALSLPPSSKMMMGGLRQVRPLTGDLKKFPTIDAGEIAHRAQPDVLWARRGEGMLCGREGGRGRGEGLLSRNNACVLALGLFAVRARQSHNF